MRLKRVVRKGAGSKHIYGDKNGDLYDLSPTEGDYPCQAPSLSHYLIVWFKEMMELQRELVPNRSIQADTKTRKTAVAEMAKAIRSPIEPLRERKQALWLRRDSSHLGPLSSVGRSVTCESPRCSCCRPRRGEAEGSRGPRGLKPQLQSSRGKRLRDLTRPERSH